MRKNSQKTTLAENYAILSTYKFIWKKYGLKVELTQNVLVFELSVGPIDDNNNNKKYMNIYTIIRWDVTFTGGTLHNYLRIVFRHYLKCYSTNTW